ncbi:hypothetical protein [Dyella sp. M7H15-1]|uniref:hypothetical protein n=1 Tax=Dyella sp. M7H15-1 TaxID=2501295 RepID=UPI00197A8EF1|nr:hypothetical protein [Dyella sp. M7H15-1]
MPGAKGKSGGKRCGAGRSAFLPTRQQRELVEQLAAFGIRHVDIPLFIKDAAGKPITEPTLRKHFAEELDTGRVKANVKVAQTLYKKALTGDTTSMIFWLKCRGDWKDAQRVELTGNAGSPIQSVNMTTEEFREIARSVADEV